MQIDSLALALVILVIIGILLYAWRDAKALSNSPSGAHDQVFVDEMAPVQEIIPEIFVVLDLETTGLDSNRHEIIEIAAIRVNRDSDMHDSFSSLVIPKGRISSRITDLTGIDRKMVLAEGRHLKEVIPAFLDFVGDYRLVAFNSDFDIGFINAALDSIGLSPIVNPVSCALKMAREAWPGKPSYKLSNLCAEAGIKVVTEHRALPDCERALHVYVAAAMSLGRA